MTLHVEHYRLHMMSRSRDRRVMSCYNTQTADCIAGTRWIAFCTANSRKASVIDNNVLEVNVFTMHFKIRLTPVTHAKYQATSCQKGRLLHLPQ